MRVLSIMLAASLLSGCSPGTHSRARPRDEGEAGLTSDALRPMVFVAGLDMESKVNFPPRAFYVDALPTETPPQPSYAHHFPGHPPFGMKEHWWNIWLTRNTEGDSVTARVRLSELPWVTGEKAPVYETTVTIHRDKVDRQMVLLPNSRGGRVYIWFFLGFVEVTECNEAPRFEFRDAVLPPRQETGRE